MMLWVKWMDLISCQIYYCQLLTVVFVLILIKCSVQACRGGWMLCFKKHWVVIMELYQTMGITQSGLLWKVTWPDLYTPWCWVSLNLFTSRHAKFAVNRFGDARHFCLVQERGLALFILTIQTSWRAQDPLNVNIYWMQMRAQEWIRNLFIVEHWERNNQIKWVLLLHYCSDEAPFSVRVCGMNGSAVNAALN